MKLSQLKIDPEFQSKIPPLQFEEEQQLEQNIIAEGRLLNPIITWNGYILDGQNTVEARRTCNGGMELPIRCKVFYGLTKEDEATLFAIQTGNATCLTAGERLRANLVAENPDALYFVGITSNAGVEFAYDGIRAPWKIYCIETAYELYKQYGCERYVEMLHIINEAWKGNVDSYLAGVIRGVARFISVYEGEYSRERLVQQLARHPKTITQLAQKDTGSSANRHMRQILRIYNGASREMSLPLKTDNFVLPPEQQPSWYPSAAAVSYKKEVDFYVTEQLEISQRGHLLCRHGAAYRLRNRAETPCGSSAEQHWKPSFAYIDRCNCYHPDGKEEKPAHPCAGGFQPGL